MNRFALYALLAGSAMLTACGGGGGASSVVGAPVSLTGSSSASQGGQLSVVDATGAPLTSLSFASADPSTVRTFTVQQANFTGSFTESDTCSGIVTVRAASNSGGTAVYRVSPIANGAGSCKITVSGAGTQQVTISVGVTSTPISVN